MFLNSDNKSNEINYIERLYEQQKRRLYIEAYRILNDHFLAEDAVHDTFEKVLNQLYRIENNKTEQVNTFLLVICRNIAIDIYRKNRKVWGKEVLAEDIEVYNIKSNDDPLDYYISKESIANCVNLIKQFKSIYSDVLLLKYVFEYSNEEISLLLKIQQTTVRKRLERGRNMLLKSLQEEANK